jgi:hypothetical protein
MDVIDFLYVSLGSSTVQLHDNLGRRACACSEASFCGQNDHAWGVYYRRAAFSCAFFCGQKNQVQRIFIRKCFPFTVGSVCHVQRFTTGSRNSLKDFRKSQMMPDQVAMFRLRQMQRLLCCGFRYTCKAMVLVSQWWWRIGREIDVFYHFRISHVLRFLSISDIFTDSPSSHPTRCDLNLYNWYKGSQLLGVWALSIVRYSKNWRTQRFGNWNCFRPQVKGRHLLCWVP